MNKLQHKLIVGCMRWGVWGENFTTQQYEQMIDQCLEIGLDSFDHADIYGHYTTESDFGNALKGNSGVRLKIKIMLSIINATFGNAFLFTSIYH